jgi:hypothetical protein
VREHERGPTDRLAVDADRARDDQAPDGGLRDVDESVPFEEQRDKSIETRTGLAGVHASGDALESAHREAGSIRRWGTQVE